MNDQRTSGHAVSEADAGSVGELIERAFHYRGDVTVHTDDGSAVTGYLYNRNARESEPFVQLFETQTGRDVSLPYRSITDVLFTGRDAAAEADQRFEALQSRSGTERHGD